jgi:hypothetical protein
MVISMPNLSPAQVSQALIVLDAARKDADWLAAFQQKGYSEQHRTALFAASQEAAARKRVCDFWRLGRPV